MARLLAGELTAPEAAMTRAKVESDPALAKLFGGLEGADLGNIALPNPDADVALRRVKMRLKTSRPDRRIPVWMPIAAAIVVAAGIFTFARTFARTRPDDAANTIAASPTTFRTVTGERDSVTLSDGSRIVLGPGSEVTVPPDFGQTRQVTLKGQGRFDVVHDAARPFVVLTSQAVITDIGTVFTVNDFDGAATDVSVQSGSVRVAPSHAPDRGVVLTAGDAGGITTRGVPTKDPKGASADDIAWLSGRLVFREAPLVKVRAELRRWYGVELVTADDSIALGHFTATFRDESLAQILDILALAFGAKHEAHGDTIVLKPAARRPAGR
jgi:transmembrane sensor